MILHYILEENVFIVIVYKLLQHQKNTKDLYIKDCFKIVGKKMIKMLQKKGETLDFKLLKET